MARAEELQFSDEETEIMIGYLGRMDRLEADVAEARAKATDAIGYAKYQRLLKIRAGVRHFEGLPQDQPEHLPAPSQPAAVAPAAATPSHKFGQPQQTSGQQLQFGQQPRQQWQDDEQYDLDMERATALSLGQDVPTTSKVRSGSLSEQGAVGYTRQRPPSPPRQQQQQPAIQQTLSLRPKTKPPAPPPPTRPISPVRSPSPTSSGVRVRTGYPWSATPPQHRPSQSPSPPPQQQVTPCRSRDLRSMVLAIRRQPRPSTGYMSPSSSDSESEQLGDEPRFRTQIERCEWLQQEEGRINSDGESTELKYVDEHGAQHERHYQRGVIRRHVIRSRRRFPNGEVRRKVTEYEFNEKGLVSKMTENDTLETQGQGWGPSTEL